MAAGKRYDNINVTDRNELIWVSSMESYETYLAQLKVEHTDDIYIILIGPTGSGKSSFIESIASMSAREPLGIAKDQFESVTQDAHIYEVMNLRRGDGGKIYIIDTPGFADPRISEFHVLDKMTYWRDRCQETEGRIRLLYFHSITDIRMPASRKQCLEMVQRFWGLRLSQRTMLVTTFWDRVPVRSRDAMEARFNQLLASHWADWVKERLPAAKFENTYDSAMEILDTTCKGTSQPQYPSVKGLGMVGTTGNPAYEALLSRLSSLEQKRQSLSEDLALTSSQGQTELITLLTKDLSETELLLQKFTAEMEVFLKRFGPPQEKRTSAAAEVANPKPAAVADPLRDTVDAAPTAIYAVDSAAPPLDVANTILTPDAGPSTFTHIADVGGQQNTSLPSRFGRWINKKANKLHLGSPGRKGA